MKTVKELAAEYYPRLWGRERLEALVEAGKLDRADMNAILAAQTEEKA